MFLYYCFCVKNAGQRLREEADMDNPVQAVRRNAGQ